MKITQENPRKHNRYVKFNLNTQFQNNCNNINQLEFIIYKGESKLRGHFFHFLITEEFKLGWRYHNTYINEKIIDSMRKALENIDCPYTRSAKQQKKLCKTCKKSDPIRFKACENIIDQSTLNTFVLILKEVLKEIINEPRFCLYRELLNDKDVETFLGLCNHRIVIIARKIDYETIYNIVTSHVRTKNSNFKYIKHNLYGEILLKSISEPHWCEEKKWL